MTSIAEVGGAGGHVARSGSDRRPGRWVRVIGYSAVALALVGAVVSFVILLGLTPIEATPQVYSWALIVNGAFVLVLLGALGVELSRLFQARRRGQAAARLHARIIAVFSAIAVIPAIVVAVAASIAFDRGLDNRFSTQSQEMVAAARQVTTSYFDLLTAELNTDLAGLKASIEDRSPFERTTISQESFVSNVSQYGFVAAALLNEQGIPLIDAVAEGATFPAIPSDMLAETLANPGVPQIVRGGRIEDTINLLAGAITVRDENPGEYLSDGGVLYVVREFDMAAATSSLVVNSTVGAYDALLENRYTLQASWGVLYIGIAVVILVAAVWFGLGLANGIVSPIRRLIGAADNVARGDLQVQVPVRRSDGDVGLLGASFNRMTDQLRSQRQELVGASDLIDSRRRFIEAVLSGVTAAVIGVDANGQITVLNRMALRLLNVAPDQAVGAAVTQLIPELAPVMEVVRNDRRLEHSHQITLSRAGRSRTINVRVTTESAQADNHGYVITMDDITDLVTAQRTSAWADVARRIAHEIKNPLTPIQLSAERLRRKFGKVITEDRAVFDQCTDTIIRQVGDIGRMVDEFSAFARMPKPALESKDLREPVREAAFLMQVGNPDIEIDLKLPDRPLLGRFDTRLITQAVTNLIKNGTEAISGLPQPREKGHIAVTAYEADDAFVVDVTDNGVGLPKEDRQRLLEPYMTTREKGTGLGLAIVRKIAEDHAGRIELLDAPAVANGGHGATVRLVFPSTGAPPMLPSIPSGGDEVRREAANDIPVREVEAVSE